MDRAEGAQLDGCDIASRTQKKREAVAHLITLLIHLILILRPPWEGDIDTGQYIQGGGRRFYRLLINMNIAPEQEYPEAIVDISRARMKPGEAIQALTWRSAASGRCVASAPARCAQIK